MATEQEERPGDMLGAEGIGSGPEYEYPTTEKDENVPVVSPEDVEADPNLPKVAGEEAPEFSDKDIEDEVKKEDEIANQWSEDLAQNEPGPGDTDDVIPEDLERLPDDRD